MPNHPLVAARPARDEWTTPADRQEQARRAYRQSVAEGRPLTGVDLGKLFGLSSRWGTSRIAEVRAADIGRHGGNHAEPTRSPMGNGKRPVGSSPAGPQRHGNIDRAERSLPIRSKGHAAALPNGNHIDDTHGAGPPGHITHPAPHRTSAPDADGNSTIAASLRTRDQSKPARGSRSLLDTTITLVVAAVAFGASYAHMLDVALVAGEHPWIAAAFPITVDGLVLAALRRGEHGRGWLALGAAASIVANVLAQFPEQAAAAGPIVSAWPPLALYGTHRLLHGTDAHRRGQTEED